LLINFNRTKFAEVKLDGLPFNLVFRTLVAPNAENGSLAANSFDRQEEVFAVGLAGVSSLPSYGRPVVFCYQIPNSSIPQEG
jgi:hypothetical protein